MLLTPEDIQKYQYRCDLIYIIFQSHNTYLLFEEQNHFEKNGLILEKRYSTECKVFHKVLVFGFKLADENDAQGHLWIEYDNNKVLKYPGFNFLTTIMEMTKI